MTTPKFSVGQRIWWFDVTASIEGDGYTAARIVGIQGKSYLLIFEEDIGKKPPHKMRFVSAERMFRTDGERGQRSCLLAHRRRIVEAVESCDVATLRRVAEAVGYAEGKE